MLLDQILAQDGAVRTLRNALANGHLAQAYLFEGPSGVGKQKAALAFASTALCGADPAGCGDCETCSRVAAGLHPDVRVFGPRDEGDRNIQVDFIREEILPWTRFAPFEAAASFVIFPQADVSFPAHHAQAANALLKTLEEPRPHVHFVLLSERPDRLLPTIRSRCQRLRFGRLPLALLDELLEAKGCAQPMRGAATALAHGRADRAIELADAGKAEQLVELVLRLDAILKAGRLGPILDLAEELSRSDDLQLVLETLALFYRDVAAVSLGVAADELCLTHRSDAVRQRAADLDAGQAAHKVRCIQRTSENIERNANLEIALDAMLLELAQGRVGPVMGRAAAP